MASYGQNHKHFKLLTPTKIFSKNCLHPLSSKSDTKIPHFLRHVEFSNSTIEGSRHASNTLRPLSSKSRTKLWFQHRRQASRRCLVQCARHRAADMKTRERHYLTVVVAIWDRVHWPIAEKLESS